jgi:hypothetical protein
LQRNVKILTKPGSSWRPISSILTRRTNGFLQKKFKFTDPKGVSYGEGIDFSKDFKIVNSQRINGAIDEPNK